MIEFMFTCVVIALFFTTALPFFWKHKNIVLLPIKLSVDLVRAIIKLVARCIMVLFNFVKPVLAVFDRNIRWVFPVVLILIPVFLLLLAKYGDAYLVGP